MLSRVTKMQRLDQRQRACLPSNVETQYQPPHQLLLYKGRAYSSRVVCVCCIFQLLFANSSCGLVKNRVIMQARLFGVVLRFRPACVYSVPSPRIAKNPAWRCRWRKGLPIANFDVGGDSLSVVLSLKHGVAADPPPI